MDLAAILAQFGGASDMMQRGPAPAPTTVPQPIGSQQMPTMLGEAPAAPSPMMAPMAPRAPQQRPLTTRQQLLQIAPLLASAILNRKNPQATAALSQGMLKGQMMARQEAMEYDAREQDRRMQTAKLIQEFAGGAQQFDDPEAFNQYLEYAESIIGGIDPSFQAGSLRRTIAFPASKAAKKKQTEAIAKLERLQRAGWTPEALHQAAERGDTVGGEKIRDLLALAEMQVQSGGKAVAPPAKPVNLQGDDMKLEAKARELGKKVADLTVEEINAALKAPAAVNEQVSPIYREYQDAKREGYTGTFQQYQNEDANRKRPVVAGQRPITQTAEANLVAKLAKDWTTASHGEREVARQYQIMQAGLSRFDADPNGGSQAIITTFNKILDPTSVVRETEYARSAHGVSLLQRMEGYRERLSKGGAGIPKAQLQEMVNTAAEFLKRTKTSNAGVRRRLALTADRYSIPHELVFSDIPEDAAPQDAAPTPTKIGRFGVQVIK